MQNFKHLKKFDESGTVYQQVNVIVSFIANTLREKLV